MSQQFVIYQLDCACQRYVESLMPPGMLDSLRGSSDIDFDAVRDVRLRAFYTLSKDPAAIFEDAVQFLVGLQRECQQQFREDLAATFEEFRKSKHLEWDPKEFDFGGGIPKDGEVTFLKFLGQHLNNAQDNYLSMIRNIKLDPVMVVSAEDSLVLDQAVRFVTKPDYYLAQCLGMRDQRTMMEIHRSFAELKQNVKLRLSISGVSDDPFLQERIAKLTYDLDQRFPAEFDDL